MHHQITTPCFLIAITMIPILGCNRNSGSPASTQPSAIAEGVIYSLEYKLADGGTGGFTRLNSAEAVPGGNGSWNVNANGRLMEDYLIITYPQKTDLGPRIVPAHRLVDLQFGDGGIKSVDENRPAPAE